MFQIKIIKNLANQSWKRNNLTGIASYLNGLALQNFPVVDESNKLSVLKIRELRQGFCDNNSDYCNYNINPNYIIKNNDVIFSWSGSLLVDIWCGGKCALNQHLFKVTSEKYDDWFYYYWTKFHLNNFIRIAEGKATSLGHIKREELDKAEVFIPNKEEYNVIKKNIEPIFTMLKIQKLELNKLLKLRNTLLPKLILEES